MAERKKTVVLSTALLSLVWALHSGCVRADESESYPADVTKCYLEQTLGSDGISKLRVYGKNKDADSRSYEVVFQEGSSHGFRFNIYNSARNECNSGEAVNNYLPPREKEGAFIWKLSNLVDSGCGIPTSFEVFDIDTTKGKKYDNVSLPEVQLDLGNANPDGKQQVLITNTSSKAVEIIGFVNEDDETANELKIEGELSTIQVGQFLSVVLEPSVMCKPGEVGNSTNKKFVVKYKGVGESEEKRARIAFEYLCGKGLDVSAVQKERAQAQKELTEKDELIKLNEGYAEGNATLTKMLNATLGICKGAQQSIEAFLNAKKVDEEKTIRIVDLEKFLKNLKK